MSRPRVPHNALTHGPEELGAVARVVSSGYWAGGPAVARLESSLADAAGVDHAVAVASGLGALRLALVALGVRPGDEVIVPAYSCVALPTAVAALGARPVPADVVPGSWNLDPSCVEQAMTRQTRAIIAVHTFGLPADIEALASLGVPVIEDCAHCFGLEVGGARAGSRSDIAILSFYATKLMGAGEGGAVLTGRGDLAERVRQHRSYVDQPVDATRLNEKMSDVTAALASCQLERLPRMIEARNRIAAAYHRALVPAATADGPYALPAGDKPRVWYRYAIESRRAGAQQVIARLAAAGVESDLPVWNWLDSDDCPVARQAYHSLVSRPIYPSLTTAQIEQVIDAVKRAFEPAG